MCSKHVQVSFIKPVPTLRSNSSNASLPSSVTRENILFHVFSSSHWERPRVWGGGGKQTGLLVRCYSEPTRHDGPSGPERIKAPSVNTKSNWPFVTRRRTCMRKWSTAAQLKKCVRAGFGSHVCPNSQSSWCIVSASLAAGDVCI